MVVHLNYNSFYYNCNPNVKCILNVLSYFNIVPNIMVTEMHAAVTIISISMSKFVYTFFVFIFLVHISILHLKISMF